jgi:hypothetical protein
MKGIQMNQREKEVVGIGFVPFRILYIGYLAIDWILLYIIG